MVIIVDKDSVMCVENYSPGKIVQALFHPSKFVFYVSLKACNWA